MGELSALCALMHIGSYMRIASYTRQPVSRLECIYLFYFAIYFYNSVLIDRRGRYLHGRRRKRMCATIRTERAVCWAAGEIVGYIWSCPNVIFWFYKPNSNSNLIPALGFDHEAYTQDCCASCLIFRISQRCHIYIYVYGECHITAWRLSGFAKPKTNRRNWKCQPRHTLGSVHNRRNAAVNPAAATLKIIIIFSKVSTREQTFRHFVRAGKKWETLCGSNKRRHDFFCGYYILLLKKSPCIRVSVFITER